MGEVIETPSSSATRSLQPLLLVAIGRTIIQVFGSCFGPLQFVSDPSLDRLLDLLVVFLLPILIVLLPIQLLRPSQRPPGSIIGTLLELGDFCLYLFDLCFHVDLKRRGASGFCMGVEVGEL